MFFATVSPTCLIPRPNRTFENDLLNYFPEAEFVFLVLNELLEFLAESVKNMIVIIKDLINSY